MCRKKELLSPSKGGLIHNALVAFYSLLCILRLAQDQGSMAMALVDSVHNHTPPAIVPVSNDIGRYSLQTLYRGIVLSPLLPVGDQSLFKFVESLSGNANDGTSIIPLDAFRRINVDSAIKFCCFHRRESFSNISLYECRLPCFVILIP